MLGRTKGFKGQSAAATLQDNVARELLRVQPGIQLQGIDVSKTKPVNGQVLTYNGRVWGPDTPLASIVISPAPTNGQILVYNSSLNVWVPTTPVDDSTPLPDQMPYFEVNSGDVVRLHPADSLDFFRATLSDGNQYTRTFTSPNYLEVDITSGGLDTGSPANSTWYALYLVNDSGALSARFSTSFVSPTGFAAYRYIGAVRRKASAGFRLAIQAGRSEVYFSERAVLTGGDTASLGTTPATSAGIGTSSFTSPSAHAIYARANIVVDGGVSGGTFTYQLETANYSTGTYFDATQDVVALGTCRMTHEVWIPFRNFHIDGNRNLNYTSSVTGTATIVSQEVSALAYVDGSLALR